MYARFDEKTQSYPSSCDILLGITRDLVPASENRIPHGLPTRQSDRAQALTDLDPIAMDYLQRTVRPDADLRRSSRARWARSTRRSRTDVSIAVGLAARRWVYELIPQAPTDSSADDQVELLLTAILGWRLSTQEPAPIAGELAASLIRAVNAARGDEELENTTAPTWPDRTASYEAWCVLADLTNRAAEYFPAASIQPTTVPPSALPDSTDQAYLDIGGLRIEARITTDGQVDFSIFTEKTKQWLRDASGHVPMRIIVDGGYPTPIHRASHSQHLSQKGPRTP